MAIIHTDDIPVCPRVLLAGQIPHTRMETALHKLQEIGKLRLYIYVRGNDEWDTLAAAIRNIRPQAMLLRPTNFEASVAVISALDSLGTQKIVIGNLGAGKEHLALLEGHPRIEKIYHFDDQIDPSEPKDLEGGPTSVAHATIFLAMCLRWPLHEAVILGRDKANPAGFHNLYEAFWNARLLKGTQWLCLGAGRQVRALLPLLQAYEIKKAFVWNSNPHNLWTPAKFRNVIAKIPGTARMRKNEPYVRTFDSKFEVVGVDDYREVAKTADIVSIHIRSGKNGGLSFKAGTEFLSLLKPTCHLINVARGSFVHEQDVVDAVKSRRLGGFAGDVISKKAEDDRNPEESKLWQLYQESYSGHSLLEMALPEWNIILLPHLASSTVNAFEDYDHVIARVLAHVGVLPAAKGTFKHT